MSLPHPESAWRRSRRPIFNSITSFILKVITSLSESSSRPTHTLALLCARVDTGPNDRLKTDRKRLYQSALLCAFLLVLLPIGQVAVAEGLDRAPNPQFLFYQANNLYGTNRYQEAAALYHQLLDSGFESGNLYFNLGNTYYKSGRRGLAVLYYEKAKRLIPHDADLRANLAFTLEGVDEGTPDWKSEFLRIPTNLFSPSQLALFTTLCFFLLITAIIIAILFPNKISAKANASGRTPENISSDQDLPTSRPKRKPNRYRPWWLACLLLFGLGFLFSLSLIGLQYLDRLSPSGVAIEDGGEVYYEPAKEATVHFILSEGSRVKIIGERDHWYLIVRRDGRKGWVEMSNIERI